MSATSCPTCAKPLPATGVCAQCPTVQPADSPIAAPGKIRKDSVLCTERYVLLEKVGEGGMGEVWKARDQRLRQDVALKFLPQRLWGDIEALEQLRREVAVGRELNHPNIVRIHDLEMDLDGVALISMAFVKGDTLGKPLRTPPGNLGWSQLRPLAAQLCAALQYLHEQGLVHSDIKPGNILLDERNQIRLADFGIARAVSRLDSSERGPVMGTLHYMSPQQLDGSDPDPADDLYAVGATFFHLLTGTPPFVREDGGRSLGQQIRYRRPPTIRDRLVDRSLPADVPLHVERAIAACLAKDPADRPGSAAKLSEMLGTVGERRPDAIPAPAGTWIWLGERRPTTARWVWPVLALTLGVGVAGGGGWLRQLGRTQTLEALLRKSQDEVDRLNKQLEVGVPKPPPFIVRTGPQPGQSWTNGWGMVFRPLAGPTDRWMSDRPITRRQFQIDDVAPVQHPNSPKTALTHPHAVEYCQRLTSRMRESLPETQGLAFRLPTRAEMEATLPASGGDFVWGGTAEWLMDRGEHPDTVWVMEKGGNSADGLRFSQVRRELFEQDRGFRVILERQTP